MSRDGLPSRGTQDPRVRGDDRARLPLQQPTRGSGTVKMAREHRAAPVLPSA